MRIASHRPLSPTSSLLAALLLVLAAVFAATPAFALDPLALPKHKLKVVENGRVLELTGSFAPGIGREFRTLLAASPGVRVVRLESDGGLVGEAVVISQQIAMRGLTTYVHGTCASACVVAFAAGSERWIDRKGRLGFHAWTTFGPGASETRDRKSQLELLVDIGIDRSLVERATRVPASNIWFPTLEELQTARAITRIWTGDETVGG